MSSQFRTSAVWLILGLVALGLRLGVVAARFDQLRLDPDDYVGLANRLAAGDGFVSEATGQPTAYRPPLYPLLIAGVLKCGGGTLALGIAQAALGTASVLLTAVVGQRLLDARRGTVAAGLLAVDPLSLQYTAYAMTETLFTTLVVSWLALGTIPTPSTARRAFFMGILFGLAALCRPTVWPWGWLLFLIGLSAKRKTSHNDQTLITKSTLARAGAALLATVLVVAPWAVRNALALGSPIVTTTHGGYTLLLANNPVVYQQEVQKPWGTTWDDAPPGQRQSDWYTDLQTEIAAELGPDADEVAVDRWMSRRAVANIRSDIPTFLRSCLFRVRRFWSLAPMAPAASGVPPLIVRSVATFYGLLFAIALCGTARVALRFLRRRSGDATELDSMHVQSRGWMAAFAFVFCLTAVHAIYWSNARMRTPIMPVVALLAAAAFPAARTPRSNEASTT